MKKQAGPFDAIDQMLAEAQPQPKADNGLVNLESQGYKNLWFSRAGQYDRSHHGTYGNAQAKELLATLDGAHLGFKPQISAGYANIGHSNGKGGEHVRGGVFDIGLSGRTAQEAQKLKALLDSQGVQYLEEGRGTSNWHLHVRGKGGKTQAQPGQQSQAPQVRELSIPTIPKGATMVPIDIGMDVPTAQQSKQANAARMKDLNPAPVELKPTAPSKGNTHAFSMIDNLLGEVGKPAPAEQPKPPTGFAGLVDAAGKMIQAAPGQVAGAFNAEQQAQAKNPLFNQQALGAAALTSAASMPTDLINLATQAPAAIGNAWAGKPVYKPLIPEVYGVRDIPGLKENVQAHPVADLVGGAVIPVEAVAGLGIKALRGTKTAGKIAELGESIPTGFVNRVGQEIVPNRTPSPYGFVDRAGQEINPALTPQEAALVDVQAKPGQPVNTKELSEAFAQRQQVPDAQIIDPRAQAIPEELGPLKTEITDSGIQVVTKAGTRETPRIEIGSDPFYRAEAKTNPEILQPTSKPGTSVADVVRDSLGRDTEAFDALNTYDTLRDLGYDIHQISRKHNSLSQGYQYSVQIGGKTIRFSDEPLSALMEKHQLKADTLAKGVKARGGDENVKNLIEMLPDSPAKQKYLSEAGERMVAEREAAEALGMEEAEAKASEFINRIDKAESPEHYSELVMEAYDPKYDNLPEPFRTRVFEKLDEVDARFNPGNKPIPTTRELALRRAENVITPEPQRLPDNPDANILSKTREIGASPSVLDSTGRPVRGVTRELSELEIPGKPKPADAPLEIPRPFEAPKIQELSKALDSPPEPPKATVPSVAEGGRITRADGGEVYTHSLPDEVAAKLQQTLDDPNSPIATLEAAQKLLDAKRKAGILDDAQFQKQLDTLRLFTEAGRNGKAFEAMRREIQEGLGTISKELGKNEIKSRDSLAPVTVQIRTRKPETEVSNLVKQLGSSEAARDKMRQLAKQYGITPTTAASGRAKDAVKNNAIQIARQIAQHKTGALEFQDVYLQLHNYKTGGVKTGDDALRSYPLRTFESANIGADSVSIPASAANQNMIAQQFEALEAIKNAPDIMPEVKQLVTKVTDNPNAGFKDIRKMRESISKNLQSFCNIWGLK